jgi:hypothetical protein
LRRWHGHCAGLKEMFIAFKIAKSQIWGVNKLVEVMAGTIGTDKPRRDPKQPDIILRLIHC